MCNKNIERMTERFKVADCKSVRETYRRFESYFFQKRNITQPGSVPVLGTGSHVFKSHYFEKILFKQNKEKMTERLKVVDCKSIR